MQKQHKPFEKQVNCPRCGELMDVSQLAEHYNPKSKVCETSSLNGWDD